MTEECKDFAKNKKLLRKNIERAKTEKAADASRRRRDVCKKCFYFQGQSQGPNGILQLPWSRRTSSSGSCTGLRFGWRFQNEGR